jgi:hypothetical protein
LQLCPSDPTLWEESAQFYLLRGHSTKASVLLLTAGAAAVPPPAAYRLHTRIARLLFFDGDLDAAEASVQRGLASENGMRCAALAYLQALLYKHRKNWGAAVAAFDRALELMQHAPRAHPRLHVTGKLIEIFVGEYALLRFYLV